MKTPKVLDKMADIVLAYRPPEKQKTPRQRKKSTKPVTQDESAKRESNT
jgi:hypothetical protein